jgi:hypothetical protein
VFGAKLAQHAMFGPEKLFAPSAGFQARIGGDALVIEQLHRFFQIDSLGDVLVILPARAQERQRLEHAAIVEEDLREQLARALAFAKWLVDQGDKARQASHVAIAAGVLNAGYHAWRTRAEHQASPNAGTVGRGVSRVVVSPLPAVRSRTLSAADQWALVDDLIVLLRRELRQ